MPIEAPHKAFGLAEEHLLRLFNHFFPGTSKKLMSWEIPKKFSSNSRDYQEIPEIKRI